MNKRGFTLVELIATIVILGVVMTVAIPNVMSIIENNKAEEFVDVAKRFITEVEYEVRSNSNIQLPANDNHATLVSADFIGLDKLGDDPYGFSFDATSFVLVIKRTEDSLVYYDYYVWLTASDLVVSSCTPAEIQNISPKSKGIKFATLNKLNSNKSINVVDSITVDALRLYNAGDKVTVNNKNITIDNIYYWK